MRPTELLQEIRQMRFEETFSIWTEGRISQEEAARMLGVCSRTFSNDNRKLTTCANRKLTTLSVGRNAG